MSNDNIGCNSTQTNLRPRSKPAGSSPTRVTRSQWEQQNWQNKRGALYAESKDFKYPAAVTEASKENVDENHRGSYPSMSPVPSSKEEERDDPKNNGKNSAVTPSPNADKGGGDDKNERHVESAEALAARRAAWPLKGITEPGEHDCLFGRGGGTNHHPGNKLYRKMVEDRKGTYLNSKRLDKPLVAMAIINDWRAMDPPGRFLKQDETTKFWDDVGDKKAREKTSQALREKTPVKQRDGDGDERGERTARFEPGTSSPRGRNMKKSHLARDHSLGETFLGENAISLEGFSWDASDRPVVRNENADVSPPAEYHPGGYRPVKYNHTSTHREHHPQPHGEHQPPYNYVREHGHSTNPLSNTSISHPAPPAYGEHPSPYHGHYGEHHSYYGHHYSGYGPPPPPPSGHGHPQHPTPPYHHSHPHPPYSPQNHPPPYSHHPPQRSREHSLQSNPLKGASTSQPASNTFAEEESHALPPYDGIRGPPPLSSPTHDDRGPLPPLPPPYYEYGSPSPRHGWPTPPQGPPTPQFTYHVGSNPSAFGRYDSGSRSDSRSNSLKSLGSSVDAYYDRQGSKADSTRSSRSSAPPVAENPGTSQDYSKIAELIRDSSDKSEKPRSNSMDEGRAGDRAGHDDTILRSQSMPYEESPHASDAGGKEGTQKQQSAASKGVQKPSLLRKLSGGGMSCPALAPVVKPHEGGSKVCRPEPVKRDTSNQPEAPETKRSIKRVVLSRDQSAVSRKLKEEQKLKPSGRLSKAQLLDRKLSVEINKLGLEDRKSSVPSLDRMTTEDVLESLIDDGDNLGGIPLASPKPLGECDRMDTVDAIARDIANGNEPTDGEWDDTLDLMNDPAPVVHTNVEEGGVNADIAEKWLKGKT